jgi:hypothetical protein
VSEGDGGQSLTYVPGGADADAGSENPGGAEWIEVTRGDDAAVDAVESGTGFEARCLWAVTPIHPPSRGCCLYVIGNNALSQPGKPTTQS